MNLLLIHPISTSITVVKSSDFREILLIWATQCLPFYGRFINPADSWLSINIYHFPLHPTISTLLPRGQCQSFMILSAKAC